MLVILRAKAKRIAMHSNSGPSVAAFVVMVCLGPACKGRTKEHQQTAITSSDAAASTTDEGSAELTVAHFIDHVRRSFSKKKTFKAPTGVTLKAGSPTCSIEAVDLHLADDVALSLRELEGHWPAFPEPFMLSWKQHPSAAP